MIVTTANAQARLPVPASKPAASPGLKPIAPDVQIALPKPVRARLPVPALKPAASTGLKPVAPDVQIAPQKREGAAPK